MSQFDPNLVNAVIPAPASLAEVVKLAANFAGNARAPATRSAYARDWADFAGWCKEHGVAALPAVPGTVALYLSARAMRLKVSTLERRLAAIIVVHRCHGFFLTRYDPIFMEIWRGIRRTLGTLKQGKAPLLVADLTAILSSLPESLSGIRDRAILLTGFAAALRRSEIVALDVSDVTITGAGMILRVRRGKTDQEGKGSWRAIPKGANPDTCPVGALKAWIMAAQLSEGPLFRAIDRFGRLGETRLRPARIARIVKRAIKSHGCAKCWSRGEIAARQRIFSAHSLRAGLATSAAAAGVEESVIMRQTGHRRRDKVQGYIRLGILFRENAAGRIGL
ncbi:MAG: tyrosine-type recombinase/integrase [Alphaproteobacteria bacterium]